MRLTPFGVKAGLFYLAMVGAYLAAPYSNLFFLLLAFLTLQWVLCALWTPRNLRGVTTELSALEPVPAGSGQSLCALILAAGRARFQVGVELELDGGRRVSAAVPVVDGAAELSLPLPALERGLHAVRRARVVSSYPLGLFSRRRAIEAPHELVVYPAPAGLGEARSGSEALAELLGAGTAGAGDRQPAGLRDHREGDELRAVHWRATARRGALVVKEWEGGGGGGLELVLDRRCAPQVLEEALALVSALVALARTDKEALKVHTQGLQATFGEGHRPWNEALRFLAGAQTVDASGPAPPPVPPSVLRLPLAVGRAR